MGHVKALEHYRKALEEQMQILGNCRISEDELSLEFIRVHALAIVQLCDQILSVDPEDQAPAADSVA